MSFFDRFRRRRARPAGAAASAETRRRLVDFMASREGVEGYLEPATSVYATTLCLVAGDGEYLRQAVRDERQARQLCADHGVPLYEAAKVGYPRRMREFERGLRQRRVELGDLPPLEVVDEPRRDD